MRRARCAKTAERLRASSGEGALASDPDSQDFGKICVKRLQCKFRGLDTLIIGGQDMALGAGEVAQFETAERPRSLSMASDLPICGSGGRI